MKIETTTEHSEKIVGVLDRVALERIVIDAVAKEAKVNLKRHDVQAKVEFKAVVEQMTGYIVGQMAVVRITIDHTAKRDAGPAPEVVTS